MALSQRLTRAELAAGHHLLPLTIKGRALFEKMRFVMM
jgi:hypothetical protein